MKIFGHRGAPAYEPENTLRSFAKALSLGVDMVEFDVYVLPSGEIIGIHDSWVDRTTNNFGHIYALDFDHLRTFDAGKGEKIPTLSEVIELIDRRVPLDIELKNTGSARAVADVVRTYIAQGWKPRDFMVSSFDHREIQLFKQLIPEIKTIALIYSVPIDYAALCEPLGARVIAPAVELIDEAFVRDAHSRNLEIYAYVSEPIHDEDVIRLYRLGVDGMFSDFPDKTRALLATM